MYMPGYKQSILRPSTINIFSKICRLTFLYYPYLQFPSTYSNLERRFTSPASDKTIQGFTINITDSLLLYLVNLRNKTLDSGYIPGHCYVLSPTRKETSSEAWKHVRDARDFNKIETRALIKFLFLQSKAPKEIHAILTETLACFLPGRAKELSAPRLFGQ